MKDCYKNVKESLRYTTRNKYSHLSEEQKNKKREYGRNRHHNISAKKKLKEYRKKYREANKNR